MILQDHLRAAAQLLTEAGVPDAMRDARVLMAHALEVDRSRITLMLYDDMPAAAEVRFTRAIEARAKRQPVAQIIGMREFYGRSFRVTGDVLDPRPETEHMIMAALEAPFERVLDLGTGSGCIVLTLLAEVPLATGVGADVSEAALHVARGNANDLDLSGRAVFQQSDWFDAIDGTFDLILSNPPYITDAEMAELSPDVTDWEPHLALTPGGDGLWPYRVIAKTADRYLTTGGRIILEFGKDQGVAIAEIFQAEGFVTELRQDYAGHDRNIVATRRAN